MINTPAKWPTPLSSDATHGGPNQRDGKGRPYLSGAVHNWPTPRANDAEKRGSIDAENPRNGLPGAVKKWPTPTRSDGMGGPGCSGRDGGDNLRTAVAVYPTPCAQDAKNSTLPVSLTDRDSIPGHLLRSGEQPGGQLNPDWVEWLMGWPVGWTSLEPMTALVWPDWSHDPADSGEVPRTATGIQRRTARLKAIGNGQVPQALAMAWHVLTALLADYAAAKVAA